MKLMRAAMVPIALSLPTLLATRPALAQCGLPLTDEVVPPTYVDNATDPDLVWGSRSLRYEEYRVGALISDADKRMLLDAAGLCTAEVPCPLVPVSPLYLHAVHGDVTEFLDGDCTGRVVGPRNMMLAYMYLFNPAGPFYVELALVGMLAEGDVARPGWEGGARIKFEMEQETGDRWKFKTDAESGDGQFQVKTTATFPMEAEFALFDVDLHAPEVRVPFLPATSPELVGIEGWMDLYRMQYDMQPGDKVSIETSRRDSNGNIVLCLNQLEKATGQDLCVTILGADLGYVSRSGETYVGSEPAEPK